MHIASLKNLDKVVKLLLTLGKANVDVTDEVNYYSVISFYLQVYVSYHFVRV